MKVIFDNGISRLTGRNAGGYPKHSYHHYAAGAKEIFRPPLNVNFAGTSEMIRGFYRKRTNSEIFAAEFVRKGGMTFRQRGKEFHTGPDDLFLIQAGLDSEMFLERDAYCFKQMVCLGGPLLPDALIATGLDKVDFMKISEPERLSEVMREAALEIKEKKEGFQLRNSERAYRVLMLLSAELSKAKYPPEFAAAAELFERNIHRRLSLDEICAALKMSQSTLNRMFAKHAGKSPLEYFLDMKTGAAKQMLQSERASVKEISEKLGYSNQLYFSAEFKKRAGVSPREFRKSGGLK
jgi:AraC-like DNA-binding protein/ribosomal protein L27